MTASAPAFPRISVAWATARREHVHVGAPREGDADDRGQLDARFGDEVGLQPLGRADGADRAPALPQGEGSGQEGVDVAGGAAAGQDEAQAHIGYPFTTALAR